MLVAFDLYQRRVARRGGSPLVPPELFAERAFTAGLATTVLFFVTVASFFLVLALELQEGRGLDPLESGLVFGFEGIGFFAATLVSGRFVARLGRQALALGALVRTVALIALYFAVDHIGAHGSVAWLAGPMLLDGAGLGLVMGPIVAIVLAGVAPRNAGAASGVLATAQQIGNALGVAIIGTVFFSELGSSVNTDAFGDAFSVALAVQAAFALAASVLVSRARQTSRERAAAPMPVREGA